MPQTDTNHSHSGETVQAGSRLLYRSRFASCFADTSCLIATEATCWQYVQLRCATSCTGLVIKSWVCLSRLTFENLCNVLRDTLLLSLLLVRAQGVSQGHSNKTRSEKGVDPKTRKLSFQRQNSGWSRRRQEHVQQLEAPQSGSGMRL